MKDYNCPDCERTDSCNGCLRTIKTQTTSTTPYGYTIWEQFSKNNDLTAVPDMCKHCANHPINGGNGICFCTLGSATIY